MTKKQLLQAQADTYLMLADVVPNKTYTDLAIRLLNDIIVLEDIEEYNSKSKMRVE